MNKSQKKLLETSILPRVLRPGRYAGGELNSTAKKPADCSFSMALSFPDAYEVGMSNLGFTIIYHLVNSLDGAVCERVFAPWPDMEAELRNCNIPLFSLESRTPLSEFDILGFSLGYEMNYTGILTVIALGGIPLRAARRTESDPIVIGGGCCCFNPEPLADFFDLFFLGEGEEALPEFIAKYREMKNAGASRAKILAAAAGIEGIYVPSLYTPKYEDGVFAGMDVAPGAPAVVRKRFVADLAASFFPAAPVMPSIEAVHDRGNLEIFRGCTRGCRFCHAGMVYRPMRERPAARIAEMAKDMYAACGYEEFSLLSFNATDYSQLDEALTSLDAFAAPKKVSVSMPSSRVDSFTTGIGARLRSVRPTGLTFAPEAGSQRMRDVINKQLSEEEIMASLDAAFAAGWKKVKLYFMIGLPTETDEDVQAIAALVDKMAKRARQSKGRGKSGKPDFTVSASNFVPKAQTPFQWDAMDDPEELRRKQRMLRGLIDSRRVKLDTHDVNISMLEGVFSRGDRRLADALEKAWELGCRFDGWTEQFRFDLWMKAFEETGIDPAGYASRKIDIGAPLPWAHLSCGVTVDFLAKERNKAAEAAGTAWCGENGPCSACGLDCRKKT